MTENVEQIQACRDALAPEDVLIGDANGGSNSDFSRASNIAFLLE